MQGYVYSIERGVVMATLSAAALAPAASGVASTGPAPSVRPPPEPPRETSSVSKVRYLSPVIEIDAEAGLALLQVRDAESGNVRFQLPPERVVREYKSAEAVANSAGGDTRQDAQAPASTPPTATGRPATTAAEAATTSSLTSTNPAAAKQA
jgi:hypothetical protein